MLRKISEEAHMLQRPTMYIGAVDLNESEEYILEDGKIQYKKVQYVPGLVKIINEIIDNSVDVALKTNFQSSNEISIKITSDFVEVKDNGTGIPVLKNEDGYYLPELAWGHARAGSNFDDDAERDWIGMNGIGSFATNCFSKKFIGQTDDGKKSYTITFKDNASTFTDKIEKSSGTTGTVVKFWPELERFGIDEEAGTHLTEIDETHMNIIKQRLINLSMTYPKINFKFNGKKINVSTFKKYVAMFGEHSEIYESDGFQFAILPNEADDFRQFTYVNGLKIPDGGTHVDVIMHNIVSRIRERIIKKYPSLKPGDVRNKLMLVGFFKNMKNTKFNSQSKEKITNSINEVNKYLGDIPYDQFAYKIYRNAAILDPITEVYRIKEELKRKQELKSLNKTTKKIKSEKYYPSIGTKKYLLLVEGESALGGLMPVLGRKECGYYCLKGKPLNAYSAQQKKFTENKELSELYKIIQNEDYENVVFATDQDLDGFHIRGLLTGFFVRYLDEMKGRLGMLQTPVIGISKKDKIVRWHYSLNDKVTIGAGETSNYYKGLGSWDEADLKEVVAKDGLGKMIDIIEFDDDVIIDEWLGDDADARKKHILANDFSIAKL